MLVKQLKRNESKKENHNEDEIGSSFVGSGGLDPGATARPLHKNQGASEYLVGAAKRAPGPVHGVVARRAGAPLSHATECNSFGRLFQAHSRGRCALDFDPAIRSTAPCVRHYEVLRALSRESVDWPGAARDEYTLAGSQVQLVAQRLQRCERCKRPAAAADRKSNTAGIRAAWSSLTTAYSAKGRRHRIQQLGDFMPVRRRHRKLDLDPALWFDGAVRCERYYDVAATLTRCAATRWRP